VGGDSVLETLASGESCEKQSEADGAADEANVPAAKRADPWRKWLWAFLIAVFILQTYYVREMLAALAVFTVLFVIGGIFTGVVYLLGRAGETTISLAEPVARRGLTMAEEFSKKASRRPRSAPAP
jgi:pheromone shutdown protein TraB